MRSPTSLAFTAVLGIGLCACNGTVKHAAVPTEADFKGKNQYEIDRMKEEAKLGIVYYPRILAQITTKYLSFTDDKGIVTVSCNPAEIKSITSVADYTNPQIMWYDAAWLEEYHFDPKLDKDGTFLELGSTSTPDRGETVKNVSAALANIASAATAVARIPGVRDLPSTDRRPPATAKPPCNSGPIMTEVNKITEIKPLPKP